MIISFSAIVLNGLQGFFKFNIYNAGHIEFAFVSTILYMLTQSIIMFYFIAAGKKIKETIINYKLNKETYNEVIALKRVLFTPLTLNMLFVGTTFILGGAVHTGAVNKYWHSGLYIFSILYNIKLLTIEHRAFIENSKILSKVGKELKIVLSNKEK